MKTDEVYKYDQFFTKEIIAESCIDKVNELYDLSLFDLIVEPSAGQGSFYKLLPADKRVGIEIDDALCLSHLDFLHQSFFDYIPNSKYKNILVIGNPPFGTQSNLAVDFFNHASLFSDVIAFIIPKTWKKKTFQNKLSLNFKLIQSIDLPKDCFFGDKNTFVRCCFQVWKRSSEPRVKFQPEFKHKDWDFIKYTKHGKVLSPPIDADFMVLAFGENPGKIDKSLTRWAPKSGYFIKSKIGVNLLISRFESLDYGVANDSARQGSLGMSDLICLYIEKYGK